ncbi:MAG: 3-deoxy-manno-octulosonate cytidylyltransferase [Synergistaceae bacterium]|nr:3-deoxy-manno-octulosonate cytidylyltransferase [Synergistaceae bacterium]
MNVSKILGIIPARYASTRFPGKPLADICGKTMIERVYTQAMKAKLLSDVVVATDDARIYDCVKSFGGKVLMTGSELPNGTARCHEAAKLYGDRADSVINIQGDEPLLDPIMIDEVAELLSENYCVTLCRELTQDFMNPNIVKVVMNLSGDALYFSRSLIPYERNKVNQPVYQHIGIYGYSLSFLNKYAALEPTPLSESESLEQLKILEHGYKIRVKITSCKSESIGVDTPEDLQRVREIINAGI